MHNVIEGIQNNLDQHLHINSFYISSLTICRNESTSIPRSSTPISSKRCSQYFVSVCNMVNYQWYNLFYVYRKLICVWVYGLVNNETVYAVDKRRKSFIVLSHFFHINDMSNESITNVRYNPWIYWTIYDIISKRAAIFLELSPCRRPWLN